jgi:hypothetical protein
LPPARLEVVDLPELDLELGGPALRQGEVDIHPEPGVDVRAIGLGARERGDVGVTGANPVV